MHVHVCVFIYRRIIQTVSIIWVSRPDRGRMKTVLESIYLHVMHTYCMYILYIHIATTFIVIVPTFPVFPLKLAKIATQSFLVVSVSFDDKTVLFTRGRKSLDVIGFSQTVMYSSAVEGKYKEMKKKNVAVFVVCLNCFSVLIQKSFPSVFIRICIYIFILWRSSTRKNSGTAARRTGTKALCSPNKYV